MRWKSRCCQRQCTASLHATCRRLQRCSRPVRQHGAGPSAAVWTIVRRRARKERNRIGVAQRMRQPCGRAQRHVRYHAQYNKSHPKLFRKRRRRTSFLSAASHSRKGRARGRHVGGEPPTSSFTQSSNRVPCRYDLLDSLAPVPGRHCSVRTHGPICRA